MATIVDSYSESNSGNNRTFGSGGVNGQGQSFTGNGSTSGSAVFYLKKVGLPTGNATANIYAHSGTFGTSSVPTGTALATSDNFDVSTLTTSLQLITFSFSGPNQIALTNGTKYVTTVEYSDGSGGNNLEVGADATSPTHGGNCVQFSGGAWAAVSAADVIFYIYDVDVPPGSQGNLGSIRRHITVGSGMSRSEVAD